MFVKIKDSEGKYVGINTDKVSSLQPSQVAYNYICITLESECIETKDELDDLIALFNGTVSWDKDAVVYEDGMDEALLKAPEAHGPYAA